MTFRTLMKRQTRMMEPRTVKFIKRGMIIISRDLRKYFDKKGFVEVLIDKDYKKLALKPSKDSVRGFKLSSSGTFQSQALKKVGIEGGIFKGRFTEGKIIIDDFPINEKMKALEYWED